jgi:maltose-binding protein MalE
VKKSNLSRREFLKISGAASAAALAAAQGLGSLPAYAAASTSTTARQAPLRLRVNGFAPSEWTERSAEHPTVVNAPRILAEEFSAENNVEIEWVQYVSQGGSGDADWMTWLTALAASGDVPDVLGSLHFAPIQEGYALPLDDYFDQPNPYTPDAGRWYDTFYPKVMASLVWADGHSYCPQMTVPYPGVEVGLAYNKEWLDRIGMNPPTTWTEQLEVSKALKEAGSGLIPWPPEAREGNVWPVALQLLVSMLQEDCPQMDLDGNMFVGVEEALPAYRAGIIGPMSPKFQTAWHEMKKLSQYWVDNWNSTDVDTMWRNGEIGLRTTGAWEFSAQKNDPQIMFERGFLPPPYVTSADVEGGGDPPAFTAGDGKLPAEILAAVGGANWVVAKDAVDRGTTDMAVRYMQWFTTPENCAFVANENEQQVPAVIGAPLGPLYTEIASIQIPQLAYSIAWYGEGLYFDTTHFNNMRSIFVAWATGQIDDATFFQRQEEETAAGADRYAATLSQ